MANKDRNKRSARKARAAERARVEAVQADAAPSTQQPSKAQSQSAAKPAKKEKKNGFFSRVASWFGDVRTEMKRVVWPSRPELKNYSVGVIISLVVFGVVIWLVDMGLVGLLSLFANLRG